MALHRLSRCGVRKAHDPAVTEVPCFGSSSRSAETPKGTEGPDYELAGGSHLSMGRRRTRRRPSPHFESPSECATATARGPRIPRCGSGVPSRQYIPEHAYGASGGESRDRCRLPSDLPRHRKSAQRLPNHAPSRPPAPSDPPPDTGQSRQSFLSGRYGACRKVPWVYCMTRTERLIRRIGIPVAPPDASNGTWKTRLRQSAGSPDRSERPFAA